MHPNYEDIAKQSSGNYYNERSEDYVGRSHRQKVPWLKNTTSTMNIEPGIEMSNMKFKLESLLHTEKNSVNCISRMWHDV